MYFLTGEYDHQVDAKNRIRIPNKLRGNEDKLYFAKGTNGCLFVFYEKAVQEKLAALEEIKISDAEKQRGLRAFTKSLRLVETDTQGRLTIPPELKSYAKINKDIKICGVGARIEIWAIEVYNEYFAGNDGSYDDDISNLGI